MTVNDAVLVSICALSVPSVWVLGILVFTLFDRPRP